MKNNLVVIYGQGALTMLPDERIKWKRTLTRLYCYTLGLRGRRREGCGSAEELLMDGGRQQKGVHHGGERTLH